MTDILDTVVSASVSRTTFAAAVAMLCGTVESRNTLPVLDNIRMTGTADRLQMTATDCDRELSVSIPCRDADGISTTVPAKALDKLLRGAPKGDRVTLEPTEGACRVRFDRPSYSLKTIAAEEFPNFSAGNFAAAPGLPVGRAELFDALSSVAGAVSTEETRYYLNGVFMHSLNGILTVVATDGHRLYRRAMGNAGDLATVEGGIIPAATLKQLLQLLKAKTGGSVVQIHRTASAISFSFDLGECSVVFRSKLVDGTFPDYQRVIPCPTTLTTAVFNRPELIESIKSVTLISEKNRAFKLSIGDNGARLDVNNPDLGSATSDLPVSWTGDAFEIGFNAKYMLELLQILTGDEVEIGFRDSGSPCRIDSADWTGVVMPMRV